MRQNAAPEAVKYLELCFFMNSPRGTRRHVTEGWKVCDSVNCICSKPFRQVKVVIVADKSARSAAADFPSSLDVFITNAVQFTQTDLKRRRPCDGPAGSSDCKADTEQALHADCTWLPLYISCSYFSFLFSFFQ
jgi:hypothetical protein